MVRLGWHSTAGKLLQVRREILKAVIMLSLAMVASACAAERPTFADQSSSRDQSSGQETLGLDAVDTADGQLGSPSDNSEQTTTTNSPFGTSLTDVDTDPGPVFETRGGVLALITSTGVMVPVVGQTETHYQVTTPCGETSFVSWGHPLGQISVVLDPGHGGDETGADDVPTLSEADLNLRVGKRTAARLSDKSISVALTRTGDYRLPLVQRAAIADHVQADLIVSIHHNTPASRQSLTPGTEVYVQSNSADSSRLGGLLYEEVFGALSQFDVEWTSRDDAGVLVVLNNDGEDTYGMIRHPETTAALIELAYLGNPKEVALLETDDYVDEVSLALADGIERYLTTTAAGTGFVDNPRTFTPLVGTGGQSNCQDPPLE